MWARACAPQRTPARTGSTSTSPGCPAPVVFNKCAGSALLADPQAMARIVSAAVAATSLPVSAKMRAGISDRARMRDCLRAVADAGADLVTLHARLRAQSYSVGATWSWIAEARAMLGEAGHRIPLVGNGSIEAAPDIARMRAETGCDAVMVGARRAGRSMDLPRRCRAGRAERCRGGGFRRALLRRGGGGARAGHRPGEAQAAHALLPLRRPAGGSRIERQRLLREPHLGALRAFFARLAGARADDQAACGSGVR